ncbi:MAG TPA: Glu/Leu/Phe/Val dehydrogenase dimerization domain-containing protein [Candidatus Limnocylindria bacterium]|nr:Glu/Leu/Phe/Val dehydrogenase dimerization domain-containing protein [Candidatus Limnocylindria bacterium]
MTTSPPSARDRATSGPVSAVGPGGHEEVVVHHDRATGLRAIVAIHSTALGAALGGTRFHPYPSDEAALSDALALARAMSSKNALAGLDHGGGKAVIIGDPRTDKSRALFLAYGRFIESLGGRYVTAGDVGTAVADLDVMAEESRWVTGKSPELGGGGDSGRLTAWGVFQGMRAGAEEVWGSPTLAGRRVGVAGLGKVGSRLVDHLLEDGAEVVAYDPGADTVAAILARHPEVAVVASAEALVGVPMDVFSPNALGGALNDSVVSALSCAVVCGAANNQLAHTATADALAARGILYMPDFLVNAGGVIQVADELRGFDDARAHARATRIYDTAREVLGRARAAGETPSAAADRLAEERIAAGPWSDRLFPGLAAATTPLD